MKRKHLDILTFVGAFLFMLVMFLAASWLAWHRNQEFP